MWRLAAQHAAKPQDQSDGTEVLTGPSASACLWAGTLKMLSNNQHLTLQDLETARVMSDVLFTACAQNSSKLC